MNLKFEENVGEIIRVGGKCYQLIGRAGGVPTNVPGDVEDAFTTCDECDINPSPSQSVEVIPSPSPSSEVIPSPSPSPSPSPASSSCVNEDPEMLITITGASGIINWCGETWNLPAESGMQKTVCPSSWVISQFSISPGDRAARNEWVFNLNGTDSLFLRREYLTYTAITLYSIYNKIKGRNQLWRNAKYFTPAGNPFQTNVTPAGFTIINAVAPATFNNFMITDEYFGSVTVSGITYTWSKGLGWP